jgi:hypothetical protein
LALVLYGAGIRLESIARATLPLSIFGARDYAPIIADGDTPGRQADVGDSTTI